MAVGYGIDSRFADHDTGPGHPERRERIVALLDLLKAYPGMAEMKRVAARAASQDELALIHTRSHIDSVAGTEGQGPIQVEVDTVASPRSFATAKLAAGLVLEMTDQILCGAFQRGFALVRPPGHHAEPARVMGFCFFNNVALAAEYARRRFGLRRIAIVDFDVHHGNGTQAAFFDSREVLFISSHQFPFYPGTGDFREVGRGNGRGYTVNFPLPAGCDDGVYVPLYRDAVCAIVEQFTPDFILVSAGFDAYLHDPLAGMKVTEEGFAAISHLLTETARRCCRGGILFVLEGGYHIEGLRSCVSAALDSLRGAVHRTRDYPSTIFLQHYYRRVREAFGEFWDLSKLDVERRTTP